MRGLTPGAGMPPEATALRSQAVLPAPGPWTLAERGKHGSHGIKNLYILDANGRVIAAVWGKPGEREATAALMREAATLLAALNRLRDCPDVGYEDLEDETWAALKQADEAIEKAGATNANNPE